MSNSNFENVQGQRNFRSNNSNYDKSNSRGRFSNNKIIGGFKIRLSDNEMKAVKNIQEAFQLKSTVAVLGFSLRTLSEMINDEKLKDSIKKYALNNKNNLVSNTKNPKNLDKSKKIDPFARPSKSEISKDPNTKDTNLDDK